jgi:hypothetical protein
VARSFVEIEALIVCVDWAGEQVHSLRVTRQTHVLLRDEVGQLLGYLGMHQQVLMQDADYRRAGTTQAPRGQRLRPLGHSLGLRVLDGDAGSSRMEVQVV